MLEFFHDIYTLIHGIIIIAAAAMFLQMFA